jgi:hypothetical protein
MEQTGDVDPTCQQFDLIAAIREWKAKSPIDWETRHVEGHQDKNPLNVLDRWATLNCEMDARAKNRLQQLQHQLQLGTAPATQQSIEGAPWPLLIEGKTVRRNFLSTITLHISGKKALQYWEGKQRFREGTASDVDWQATEDSMQAMPTARQHWLVKQASGFCATGKMMVRRKEWTMAKCPRCDCQTEDSEHVLRCQGSGAKEQWQQGIDEVESWMRRKGTAMDVTQAITQGLDAWYNDTLPLDTEGSTEVIRNAVNQQTRIGWKNLLEGCPALAWAEVQQAFFRTFGNKRTGRRWVAALVQKLAETAWHMWDHRNSVNNDKETATRSLEVNRSIKEEYAKGFGNLDRSARQLARQAMSALLVKGLGYRESWLRAIQAAKNYAAQRQAARRPSREILEGIGYVEWIRRGRPDNVEER